MPRSASGTASRSRRCLRPIDPEHGLSLTTGASGLQTTGQCISRDGEKPMAQGRPRKDGGEYEHVVLGDALLFKPRPGEMRSTNGEAMLEQVA